MSLQVWLPLNGDLRNQGLSTLSFNNISDTNTTINNSGKIGKCYSNDSHTAGGLISDGTLELGQQQSMFCWFKFTDLHSGASLGGSLISQHRTATFTGMGITIRYVSATTGYLSVNTGNGSSRTYNTYYGTTLLQANTWYHGGYTYDGSTIKIYVNGICEKTQAFSGMSVPADYISCFCWNLTGTSGNTIQENYKFQGFLNDVRIYDHCLSENEVKRLAQGLIVHYPLNRQGLGQENLLRGTYDWSQWIAASRASFSNEVATLVGSTADWRASIHSAHLNKSLLDGTTIYTWSFEYKSTVAWSCVPVIGGTATDIDAASNSRTKYCSWQTALDLPSTNGEWKKYVFTSRTITESQMTSSSGDVNSWFLQIYNRTNDASVQIRHIKLEKGSVATPWCPNIIDIDNIGLESTIEYDISGFGNNGTRTNFPQQNLLLGTDFSSQYTTNLVTNSSTDWTKLLRGYNSNTLHSFANGEDTVTLSTASNLGVCFVRKATGIGLDPNAYYTLSCEAKSTQTAKPLCIGLSYYNNSNTWVWRGGTNPTNFTIANTWQKFSLTFKPDADTQYICYCFTVVGVANSTDTFTIRHCKLEKGSVATPWVEDSYSSWTSDTPKYSVSTEFNGTDSTIDCGNGFHVQGAQELTWSCWVYSNDWDSGIAQYYLSSQEGGGIILQSLATSNNIRARIHAYTAADLSTYAYYQADCTYANSGIGESGWHMLTGVYTPSSIKLYIDGVLKKTTALTTYGIHFNNTAHMFLGAECAGTTYSNLCACKLSDCRIYATALSADDVKSLYQNCATIGPDGTIYGQLRS